MDINTKKLKKNAFRVSKVRGMTASRVRVPGGLCNAEVLKSVAEIAEKYGNGTVHITTRQGFEIEGIHMEDMEGVNEMLQPIIANLGTNQEIPGTGYPASGTRNVSACIGNRVCPFANYDTAAFARRIEDAIFPNDLHFKVALTGCPNDCIKARMHDFGIIGMTMPQYDPNRCVTCRACIMGRTGKRNPRLGEDFLVWVDEDTIVKVILNTYRFVEKYIDPGAPGGKEHIGYIIDRVGFQEYKKWALEGVDLLPETIVKDPIYWNGIHYR
mgnify:CR=1 FL=1